MHFSFTAPVLSLKGQPLVDSFVPGEAPHAVTYAELIAHLLSVADPADSAEVKYQRYTIAQRITENPADITLSSEEVALVKKTVGRFGSPVVVGRVWDLLESAGAPSRTQ